MESENCDSGQEIPDSYQKISFEKLMNYWSRCDNSDIGVYIHNPFCPSICDYCVYAGAKFAPDVYNKFYGSYLPEVIDMYRDILATKRIVSWFFGGGTPSIVESDKFRQILEQLPGIDEGEKTIEVHPGACTPGFIEVLHQYEFDNVLVGAQTFDAKVQKEVKRAPASFQDVKKLCQKIKKIRNEFVFGLDGLFTGKFRGSGGVEG